VSRSASYDHGHHSGWGGPAVITTSEYLESCCYDYYCGRGERAKHDRPPWKVDACRLAVGRDTLRWVFRAAPTLGLRSQEARIRGSRHTKRRRILRQLSDYRPLLSSMGV
jgi:hypothetical protein